MTKLEGQKNSQGNPTLTDSNNNQLTILNDKKIIQCSNDKTLDIENIPENIKNQATNLIPESMRKSDTPFVNASISDEKSPLTHLCNTNIETAQSR